MTNLRIRYDLRGARQAFGKSCAIVNELIVGTITSWLPFAKHRLLDFWQMVVRGIPFAPCDERQELSLYSFLRNRRLNLADPRFQTFPMGFPSGTAPL